MTEYLVLESDGGEWSACLEGTVRARSAKGAIAKILAEREVTQNQSGQYVAVPYRSWKPVTVKVETKTALRFS
jgi:hypothetical protein